MTGSLKKAIPNIIRIINFANGDYVCKLICNSVLRNSSDVNLASKRLKEMGLFPHHGIEKSWDTCKIIEVINTADRNCCILDVGCHGSPILPMLKRLGFTKLYGCDLVIKPRYNPTLVKLLVNIVYRVYKREYLPIVQMYYDPAYNLSIQNLERTTYPDDIFEYVTSVSVIEHGVNITSYFREMSRILKKGGYLLTSTDYWPDKVTHKTDVSSKEQRDNVFSRSEIENMIEIAKKYDLRLTEPIDHSYEEKVVSWNGLQYTFIFFGMRKD